MSKKHLIIYGGSSLIARELIKLMSEKFEKITIFCRNEKIVQEYINHFENVEFNLIQVDLIELEKNIQLINNISNDIDGLIWIAGYTGDADLEFKDYKEGKKNIDVNFLNPILLINQFIPKFKKDSESFIVGLTSVAGLRGRANRLFYSSAKSGFIAFLSGLRQKLKNSKINVITVIPGYMKTIPFEKGGWTAPSFLITNPEKAAKLIFNGIYKKKEIIYINFLWRLIMIFISLIPEKIFKKLEF